jgi:hypothetical protein
MAAQDDFHRFAIGATIVFTGGPRIGANLLAGKPGGGAQATKLS